MTNQISDKPITMQHAKRVLSLLNVTIRLRDGEYRVNFKNGTERTAYYTDCLDDAFHTGLRMTMGEVSELINSSVH